MNIAFSILTTKRKSSYGYADEGCFSVVPKIVSATAFFCGESSESQTSQTANNQQVAVNGAGNLTLGAGANISAGGAVQIVSSDVNAIDLAHHVTDLNAAVSANALNTVAHNADNFANSTLSLLSTAHDITHDALQSGADLTRQTLASNTAVLQGAASVIGTSEIENSRIAELAISTTNDTSARELALYQQGLQFANSVANQSLQIAANATPQTSAAQSEILAGTGALAGTQKAADTVEPTGLSTGGKYGAYAALAAGIATWYFLFKRK